ncbi:MAG: protein-methionine-sulfoxide reductase heme-binding subunit MsrQ [Gemmatimonadota bacterium]
MISGVVPAAVITWRLLRGDYVNPAEALEHATGFTALWYLLASLSATPLRYLTTLAAFTRLRKPLGLWSFGFALIHMSSYLVFDQSLLWGEIVKDILERPYITVGFSAFLILLALAVTSPIRVMKRMGGKRWQALHRMVYVAATLGVLHFLWLVKRDITEPAIAGVTLIVLLAIREVHNERRVGMKDEG